MLKDNLSAELEPYWQRYKEIFKRINKTIRFSINEMHYGVYDSSSYSVNYEGSINIINNFSVYFNTL